KKQKKDDFVEKMAKELQTFQKKKNYAQLSAKSIELGLLLLNAVPEFYNPENHYHYREENLTAHSPRFARICEITSPETIWDDYQDLWVFLVGKEIAPYIKGACAMIPKLAYQTGYYRKSFTAPRRQDLGFLRQLNFVINLTNYLKHDIPLSEYILYSNHLYMYYLSVEYIFAAAINEGNQDIYNLLLDIAYNRHDTAKVSRNIIKALLLCDKPEAWEAVEKLLLAAQRQEGLRQTILECLDETNLEAMKRMIKLILDEKLTRFSSVVRALDVWVGLGWEAQKESTIIRFMEFAHLFLTQPEAIMKAMESKDNAEIIMALWAQGILDVDGCVPLLDRLLEIDNAEKNLLALYFVGLVNLPDISYKYAVATLEHFDLAVFAQSIMLFQNNPDETPDEQRFIFFDKLEARLQEVPLKGKSFEGKVFSWLNFSISRNNLYGVLINLINFDDEHEWDRILVYYDEIDSSYRGIIASNILPYYREDEQDVKPLSKKQRDFALKVLKDRNDNIRSLAMTALDKATIEAHEVQYFLDLLGRKSSEVRKSVIDILLKLPSDMLQASIEKLLKSAVEQRLAGLDLITQCKMLKLLDLAWLQSTVQTFADSPKITDQEKIIVNKLLDTEVDVLAFDASNGYGLYDPQNKTPYQNPALPTQAEYINAIKDNSYGLSQSPEAINKALIALEKLIIKHKDFEYTYENWDNTLVSVLVGNEFNAIKKDTINWTDEQHYNNYPLPEVWEKWVIDSQLTPRDLMLINLCGQLTYEETDLLENAKAEEEEYLQENEGKKLDLNYETWSKKLFKAIGKWIYTPKIPNKSATYYWNNPVFKVLGILPYKFPYPERKQFVEGLVQNICYHIPAEEVGFMLAFKTTWNTQQYTWRNHHAVQTIYNVYAVNVTGMEDDEFTRYWHLQKWRYETLPADFIDKDAYLPTLYEYARAFQLGYVTKDELVGRIMKADAIGELTQPKVKETYFDVKKAFPFLVEMMELCKRRILEIELKRGDSSTAVTNLAASLLTIEGVQNFIQILVGLGKDTLHRGYIYHYGGAEYTKKELFGILLKRCFPANSSQAEFDEAVKAFKIPEKRLVEAVTYSPQWIKYAENNLGWENMQSAVWWLHAHTNGYHSAETETEIAHYSKVDITEFQDGAVDTFWFQEVYQSLGEKRWQMLYDSAKYISDGNGHTRAKLYADIILGKISLEDVAKKVADKRNQDYLRVYGLVALDKKNPEKDVLQRYQYLQKFKKESKQFGSQRQASEGLAVKISLDNLARTAGFTDPMRLTWAMETEEAIDIINRAKTLNFNTVTVQLVIDEDGQAEIVVEKAGKPLKSIPADLKKEPAIIELKEFSNTLQNQYKRTRKSLEDAMIAGDSFSVSEIEKLMTHPVVSPMLRKLVLLSGGKLGFWQAGKLVSPSGESSLPTQTIQIAHCTDLFAGKEWGSYQQHCFEKQIKQPFKQVFRELYVPTADELKENTISRRYAGHQVQPKKTVALLKSQGWTVDYDEGLQKVFHKEGFIAKIYAMADWFTPSDVESPTLETVEFIDRKTWKNVPFAEMSPRIFSEVMRDVDLVVSVAHVGEVDPEASQSSIELRTALVRETLRLFKITNVELKGNHALIKGKHGDYSVHLGSAVAHKVASTALFILPVHSQHRGRMFLPFLDEDPRTAELMSKILLLAKDNEIQDPTILKQLL
ncbi:MAG: DUF4132 domain-containing protein, partial [Bacteroidetes bacterium]